MSVKDEGRPAAWKTAMVVTAVVAVGFVAWALKGIFTPFVLAVFLLLMIDGLARALCTHIPGFPQRLATPAALALIVAFFLVVIWMVADNTAQFVGQAGGYERRLNAILGQVATRAGLHVPPTVDGLMHQLNPAKYVGTVAQGAQGVAFRRLRRPALPRFPCRLARQLCSQRGQAVRQSRLPERRQPHLPAHP